MTVLPMSARRSPLLFAAGQSTVAVAFQRSRFLEAAQRIPASKALLLQLFSPKAQKLTWQNHGTSDPSPELVQYIQNWAVRCHLAGRPVENWWIFGVAIGELRREYFGPLDEENIGPRFQAGFDLNELADDESITYCFVTWCPTLESRDTYVAQQVKAFRLYLDRQTKQIKKEWCEAGYRPIRSSRPEHYEWLVRYQILREQLLSIAHDAGVAEGTVRTKVFELRSNIQLPRVHPVGRPRKKL